MDVTDDIVTRLREFDRCRCNELSLSGICPTCQERDEAADEIERLRRWQEWGLHVAVCPNWTKRTCWDCVSPDNQDTAEQNGSAQIIKEKTGQRE